MTEAYTWYPRLAEIPGIRYVPPSGIDRGRLRGVNAKPRIERYRSVLDGTTHVSAMWGDTSQSPAAAHGDAAADAGRPRNEAELNKRLRGAYEALELPGSAHDYHFKLLGAYQTLWSSRTLAAWALNEVERLCLIDIELIEAHPLDPGEDFDLREVGQPAFNQLIQLYQREGYLREAIQIAERAAHFLRRRPGQGEPDDPQQHYLQLAEEISARIAAIERPDGS